MSGFNWKAFGDEVADLVKRSIVTAVEPLTARLKALEDRPPVKGEKGDKGEQGEKGEQGIAGVGEKGEAGPRGEKGDRGDAGSPGEKGEPGLIGKEGAPGRDGRDGAPGRDGEDGKPGLNGKDGADGLNGKDGLGFDDIKVEFDGERGFKFAFVQGERRKEFGNFIVPMVIDRGVWKEGPFKRGDGVTWGGSFFIAQRDTEAKPETADSGWRLAVKRGRDGRDGKDGKPGERGPEGAPGRDGRTFAP